MDYKRIHDNIIAAAKTRDWYSSKYRIGGNKTNVGVEVHHITPRSLGGNNDIHNLVVLSFKEHYIIHLLLCKIYKNNSINKAFFIMKNRTIGKNSISYDRYRTKHFQNIKGYIPDNEQRLKKSLKMKKYYSDPNNKIKTGLSVKRKYATDPIFRAKMVEISKRPRREDVKEKMKQAAINYWSRDSSREMAKNNTKRSNAENLALKEKRLNAIKFHQKNKSEEWKRHQSIINKKRMTTPEMLNLSRINYFDSNFNNSIGVVCKKTGKEFTSLHQAAIFFNMNYSTLKKYFYNNNEKCPIIKKHKIGDSNENI